MAGPAPGTLRRLGGIERRDSAETEALKQLETVLEGPNPWNPSRPLRAPERPLQGFFSQRNSCPTPLSCQPPGPKICWQRGLREASWGSLRGLLKRAIWRMVRLGSRFGVPYSKGDLTGYLPAACRAYRAAHSCLWDWELCRPPEGFRLQSCLTCRLDSPGSLSLGV